MGAHKMIACPDCSKEIRSDNMAKHKRSHERVTKKNVILEKKKVKSDAFLEIIKQTIANQDLNKIYHGYYRTDCFAEGQSSTQVLDEFERVGNLACECGKEKECSHSHAHFLGLSEKNRHKDRLSTLFKEKQAYAIKKLNGGDASIAEKIERVKHFIHSAAYIQTEHGWHKKISHLNPHTFETLADNKRFLANIYKTWMWAQVSYMRHIQERIDKVEQALANGDLTKERRLTMENRYLKLNDTLEELEKVWGEEHHYKDSEMEADLDMFIDACIHNKLEIYYNS